MELARVRTVILGGGRSQRMGFDKLVAPFAGEPLGRRVARALAELEPLFVTTPAVAALVRDVAGVHVVETPATAGPSVTLALANAAVTPDLYLAVTAADLPFLDAARVRAFVARAGDDADLAWPVVAGTPGHPVVWSPRARAHIASLGDDDPPSVIRRRPEIRTAALDETDDAYVVDVDTPEAWIAAEARARAGRRPAR
ncbi:MAG TPA: NTP transferase domain-containing protein [Candidatus Elarobacter sp.]|jgi:molybdenum cofactor cytidylyltransferase|nr:NTP transferase domain-containing protein [Candidatus Elarobacter sp.]